jgi:hypothetical protein
MFVDRNDWEISVRCCEEMLTEEPPAAWLACPDAEP